MDGGRPCRFPKNQPWGPLDLIPLLESVDAACRRDDLEPLMLLIGVLEAARQRCLRAVGQRMGQSEEPSQGRPWQDQDGRRVRDRWLPPTEAAKTLGISYRTLSRRRRLVPYSSFCIPEPSGRGFKVSEAGLEEHMRRARTRTANGR